MESEVVNENSEEVTPSWSQDSLVEGTSFAVNGNPPVVMGNLGSVMMYKAAGKGCSKRFSHLSVPPKIRDSFQSSATETVPPLLLQLVTAHTVLSASSDPSAICSLRRKSDVAYPVIARIGSTRLCPLFASGRQAQFSGGNKNCRRRWNWAWRQAETDKACHGFEGRANVVVQLDVIMSPWSRLQCKNRTTALRTFIITLRPVLFQALKSRLQEGNRSLPNERPPIVSVLYSIW